MVGLREQAPFTTSFVSELDVSLYDIIACSDLENLIGKVELVTSFEQSWDREHKAWVDKSKLIQSRIDTEASVKHALTDRKPGGYNQRCLRSV